MKNQNRLKLMRMKIMHYSSQMLLYNNEMVFKTHFKCAINRLIFALEKIHSVFSDIL